MRAEAGKEKLELLLSRLGRSVRGPGRVYLVGGATALLLGWRTSTVDVDLKADPEPEGFFEALAGLKDELDVNIEMASPEQFIPELPGWRERGVFIARHGAIEFFHYDPYAQALAKLRRGYGRDQTDVSAMLGLGLIEKPRLWELFTAIEPRLIRYPGVNAAAFRRAVEEFCDAG